MCHFEAGAYKHFGMRHFESMQKSHVSRRIYDYCNGGGRFSSYAKRLLGSKGWPH
jgi:hypothetical protein